CLVWSESLLPATDLARIIAGDSLHRVWSPVLSAPRPILKGPEAPAHFHAVAASPGGTMTHLQGFSSPLPDSNRRPPPYHGAGQRTTRWRVCTPSRSIIASGCPGFGPSPRRLW